MLQSEPGNQLLVARQQVLEGGEGIRCNLKVGHLHVIKEFLELGALQHQPGDLLVAYAVSEDTSTVQCNLWIAVPVKEGCQQLGCFRDILNAGHIAPIVQPHNGTNDLGRVLARLKLQVGQRPHRRHQKVVLDRLICGGHSGVLGGFAIAGSEHGGLHNRQRLRDFVQLLVSCNRTAIVKLLQRRDSLGHQVWSGPALTAMQHAVQHSGRLSGLRSPGLTSGNDAAEGPGWQGQGGRSKDSAQGPSCARHPKLRAQRTFCCYLLCYREAYE
mmetsp:Transcript_11561/g.34698  ORF Transcript_11561/g.34698 Transcript_11561/m.34698 type:complete len:271 (-) Transcript_11561:215-1027(-)